MSTVVARIAAVIALVALLAVGIWFFGAVLATSTVAAIVLSGAWVVACAILAELAARRRPRLRWTLRGTLAVFAAASLFGFFWTSVRETVVDEPIVEGVPASKAPPPPYDPLAPQPQP